MLSKCANPACSNPFLYLHNGKLFRMDVSAGAEAPEGRKAPSRVEFFWLCIDCAASMTLNYRYGVGVVATSVNRPRRAAG
jgi:hypothetical protein